MFFHKKHARVNKKGKPFSQTAVKRPADAAGEIRFSIPKNTIAVFKMEAVGSLFRDFAVSEDGARFVYNGEVYFCPDLCDAISSNLRDTPEMLDEIAKFASEQIDPISPEPGDFYDPATMVDVNCTGFSCPFVGEVVRVGLKTKSGQVLFKALVKV